MISFDKNVISKIYILAKQAYIALQKLENLDTDVGKGTNLYRVGYLSKQKRQHKSTTTTTPPTTLDYTTLRPNFHTSDNGLSMQGKFLLDV